MFKDISVIGDGAMGTVCSMLLCEKQLAVRMWGFDRAQLDQIAAANENIKFLPGYKLPSALKFEPDDARAFAGADLIISAVPCQYMRSTWARLKSHFPTNVPIVSVAKGIENSTLMRPSQIIADVVSPAAEVVVLSGPTIADELARKLPATACAASANMELAQSIQHTFTTSWFRVYTNSDVVGVELAGAMKNVIAIAAGMLDGIGAGDNAKAALLSRGLAEIMRLGIALGADAKTFAGLAGLGDLVTTCISPLGRNRSLGERIGKGFKIKEALKATNSVVEGVATCASVTQLARSRDIDMPITFAVYQVLFENKPVPDAVRDLMTRRLKAE